MQTWRIWNAISYNKSIDCGGIVLGLDCLVSHCLCENNMGTGIAPGGNSQVIECQISGVYDGIVIGDISIVRNCAANGQLAGSGILVTGTGIRIEADNVTSNFKGIELTGAGNIVLGNSARGNTTIYVIAADIRYGQIVDGTAPGSPSVNGNSAPSTLPTSDPAANYSY